MNNSRLKLGIIFKFDPKWMGGIVYIINLINTLNFLDDEEKPEILLFYNPDLERFIEEMKYPYLTPVKWAFPPIILGSLKSVLYRKNIFIDGILKKFPLDAVYPLQDYPVRTKTKTKLVSWCADFQYKYYPEFFSRFQLLGRDYRNRLAFHNTDNLVLSSHDALNDLKRFFKLPATLKTHIYHFVSVIDELQILNTCEIKLKYKLPEKYFLISNQFHKHKNHKAVLIALSELKKQGIIKHVAMTGKFPEATDSPYMSEIHSIINNNQLHHQVILLGLISRIDQLQIMKLSQAIIQPSLFEGWSTVIEDAISLQVPVIASNLKVNIEQLGEKGTYFDPTRPKELSCILKDYPERDLSKQYYEAYSGRIRNTASDLLNIFKTS